VRLIIWYGTMFAMAKKNKTTKKHRLKYAQPTTNSTANVGVASPSPTVQAATAKPAVPAGPQRDFSFVAGDLRRLLIFAGSLVALELILWYLVSSTGLGDVVYNLIQV
jgi:hypothetical protein